MHAHTHTHVSTRTATKTYFHHWLTDYLLYYWFSFWENSESTSSFSHNPTGPIFNQFSESESLYWSPGGNCFSSQQFLLKRTSDFSLKLYQFYADTSQQTLWQRWPWRWPDQSSNQSTHSRSSVSVQLQQRHQLPPQVSPPVVTWR